MKKRLIIKRSFLSKPLVVFFCILVAKIWEGEFYAQTKLMWLGHEHKYRKFNTYLKAQLLNKKRSPVISVKFNNIFSNIYLNGNIYLFPYLTESKLFPKLLSKNHSESQLELNKEIILMYLGLNLTFFGLLSPNLRMLQKRKLRALNILFDYISLTRQLQREKYPDLYSDLFSLKFNDFGYKYLLNIDYLYIRTLLRNDFFSIKTNNLTNRPRMYGLDKEYDINEETRIKMDIQDYIDNKYFENELDTHSSDDYNDWEESS